MIWSNHWTCKNEGAKDIGFPKKGLSESVMKNFFTGECICIQYQDLLKHHNVTEENANIATRRETQKNISVKSEVSQVSILHCIIMWEKKSSW